MGPVIVVEVLDRAGSVRARSRHDRFPVTIGRGYDNDVILDDEYVSPCHLSIQADDGGALRAVDLQSANGLFVGRATVRVAAAPLGADTRLRIGQTSLRIRTPEYLVAAAVIESRGVGAVRRRLDEVWTFVAVILVTAGLLLLDAYWQTYTRPKLATLALWPTAIVAALLGWAGLWSLTSRLYGHRSSYFAHAVIACLGLWGLLAFVLLHSYYAFGFAAEVSADVLLYGGLAVVASGTVCAHLRLCGTRHTWHQALFACLVVSAVVSLGWLTRHVMSTEDADSLDYWPT